MYKDFAYYYDLLMEDTDYKYFANMVSKYFPIDTLLLDAGCGTGSLTILLAQMGYKICGVDKSEEMLKVFQNKLMDTNLVIPIYEGDIEVELAVDAFSGVISFFDVMNYVDHELAFKVIYDSLKSGGKFLFDVYQVSYLNQLIGYHEEENNDDFSYTWVVAKGDSENSIIHHIKIDEKIEEIHSQKTYELAIYTKALMDIGFRVSILEESDEKKLFFLCEKGCYNE